MAKLRLLSLWMDFGPSRVVISLYAFNYLSEKMGSSGNRMVFEGDQIDAAVERRCGEVEHRAAIGGSEGQGLRI